MASNIDIQKKCEWCGVIFTAHKTSTAYCSHRCANLAYKERVRKKRVQEFQLKFDELANYIIKFNSLLRTCLQGGRFFYGIIYPLSSTFSTILISLLHCAAVGNDAFLI